jgi:hypothetical protein
MKPKPSTRFFLTWLLAYSLLDLLLEAVLHHHLTWRDLPGALEGALLGAALTWFFALFYWYKSQDRF